MWEFISTIFLVNEQNSYRIESVDFVDGVVGEELGVLLDVLHHLLRLVDEDGPGAGHVTPVQLNAVHFLCLSLKKYNCDICLLHFYLLYYSLTKQWGIKFLFQEKFQCKLLSFIRLNKQSDGQLME